MLILHKVKALLRTVPKVVLVLVGAVVLSGVVVASINVGGGMFGGENSVNLQHGLVGHWDMNGDAKDRTPHGNHGDVQGATLTVDRRGRIDSAYEFDGNGSSILAEPISEISKDTTYSFSVWALLDAGAANHGQIFQNSHGGSDRNGLVMRTNNEVAFGYFDGSSWNDISGPFTPGQWHHIVGVNEEGSLSLYIDGESYSQSGGGTYAHTTPGLYIGRVTIDDRHDHDGKIDDVRIYDRALSEAEISQLHDSYQPTVQMSDLQKGLMGHWDMNGDAKDRTSHGNHGILVNSPVLTEDRFGTLNSSFQFNGADDYITIDHDDSLDIGSSNFSVSFWFKPDNVEEVMGLLGRGRGDNETRRGYSFRYNHGAGGRLMFVAANHEVGGIDLRHSEDLTGQWNHVSGVIDRNDKASLYLNGVLVDSQDATYLLDTDGFDTGTMRIGRRSWTNIWHFEGKIDDVRIYNRALSESEINQLHDSYQPTVQMSDLQKGLVGHWDMNGDAKDRTPYSNHGDVQGATLAANRLGRANNAYEFNGVDDYVDTGGVHVDTGKVTASAWIKLVSPPSTRNTIISSDEHRSGNEPQFVFATNASTNTYRSWINDDPTGWVSAEGGTLKIGVWVHYVFTYDGSFLRLYENGNEIASQEHSGAMNNSGGFKTIIGSRSSADVHWFGGLIDDVRIYNRALSAEEINLLYSSY